MSKTTEQRFRLSYDEVITKAQSMEPQFRQDLPAFTAFNPKFTLQTCDDLQSLTSDGLNDYSQSAMTALIEQSTERVHNSLTQAKSVYKKVVYYAENALGTSDATNDSFGRTRYEKARKSEKEMVSLLKQVQMAISYDDNEVKMLAAGMPVTLKEESGTISAELGEADGEQEKLKKQQLLVTQDRIELFNKIWDLLSRISEAAKIIFEDDPARLAIYRLYDETDSPEEDETPLT